jgi:hypothetical protein
MPGTVASQAVVRDARNQISDTRYATWMPSAAGDAALHARQHGAAQQMKRDAENAMIEAR